MLPSKNLFICDQFKLVNSFQGSYVPQIEFNTGNIGEIDLKVFVTRRLHCTKALPYEVIDRRLNIDGCSRVYKKSVAN